MWEIPRTWIRSDWWEDGIKKIPDVEDGELGNIFQRWQFLLHNVKEGRKESFNFKLYEEKQVWCFYHIFPYHQCVICWHCWLLCIHCYTFYLKALHGPWHHRNGRLWFVRITYLSVKDGEYDKQWSRNTCFIYHCSVFFGTSSSGNDSGTAWIKSQSWFFEDNWYSVALPESWSKVSTSV